MQKANLEVINHPEQEIEQKVESYFKSNGFKTRSSYEQDAIDGDFAFEIRGTLDDIRITVAYKDYKPKRLVVREIMALDERISDVECARQLSDETYRDKSCDMCLEPIYVMIDGVMHETNWFEYVNYAARNIDYTKRDKYGC